MNDLNQVRLKLIEHLWEGYKNEVPHARIISDHLQKHFIKKIPQDHFAIIDLPSEYSGIEPLKKIFEVLGFRERGRDYLPLKQNAFLWMAETESTERTIEEALPQVVLADFRMDELPLSIQNIISKYSIQIKPSPLKEIEILAKKIQEGSLESFHHLVQLLKEYLNKREWSLPTVADFEAVNEVNELLAWTLVFGRMPNHFTFQIHRIAPFVSLSEFNQYIMNNLHIKLNCSEGVIKGSEQAGLEQSSTLGEMIEVTLADGVVSIPNRFVEFIWRYPIQPNQKPQYWKDYFNDFVATHANGVIESLYS